MASAVQALHQAAVDTIINQAGQAVPVFVLIMGIYLCLSLVTSFLLNIYNRRVQVVERWT